MGKEKINNFGLRVCIFLCLPIFFRPAWATPGAGELGANLTLAIASKLIPAMEGRRFTGFILSGVEPQSLMESWGLRDGDRLVELDGSALNAGSGMEMISTLLSGDEARLVVVRHSKRVMIRIPRTKLRSELGP